MRKCPFCAEEIQEAAIKCKHCNEWLSEKSSADSQSKQTPSRIACADGRCTGALGSDGICSYCGKSPDQVEQDLPIETKATPQKRNISPPQIATPKMSRYVRFQNPSNGHIEEVSSPGLWTFLFGFFYFAIKGVWTHAIASLILAFMTWGFSWLIYPFFASGIMHSHYLRKGWIEIP